MITITSITPSKNSTNVSVNQDLEIRVSADFKLDPRNVSFKLNEIDIVPNVFSIYNGATDHELIITLYTRKRIKYGDTYRYGQDGLRYGMRDIYPSILNYASRYVCSFTVWGTNDSNVEETISDSFVFSTEEGIFYNSNPNKYFYSYETQNLANKLPDWSKARSDKYSNFQQLLNPIGEILEKQKDMLDKVALATNIYSVNLKELPYLYKYELSKDFEFKNFLNQDGSTYFVQPDISGIQGITRFDLFTEEENTLSSLYYNKIPTRIDTNQVYIDDNILLYDTIADEKSLDVDLLLEREGSFCLYCLGVETSIFKDYTNNHTLLKCRITGLSLIDQEQVEDIVLYNERFLFTKKLWKKITNIEFINLNNQNITYRIYHFPIAQSLHSDIKKIISPEGNTDRIIWNFENRNNQTILQKHITIGETALDILKFAGATEAISEYSLKDIDNQTYLNLKDLVVDSYSNYVYGIDNNYLYIFDKREPYPTKLKLISGQNGEADFVLGIDTDDLHLNEDGEKEITLKCIHQNPGKKILKYRIKVTKPDNSVEYILPTGVTANSNNSSIFAKQTAFQLPDVNLSYVLTSSGEYIFDLETMYQGGTVSKDSLIVFIKDISAIAKYKLSRILNGAEPVSITIDMDGEIKIFTNNSMLHSLILRKDGIVIDYLNKIIFSYEKYTSIDVE